MIWVYNSQQSFCCQISILALSDECATPEEHNVGTGLECGGEVKVDRAVKHNALVAWD